MSNDDSGKPHFGAWTPIRCAYWRALPEAEQPAFMQWVKDANDLPRLPPGVDADAFEASLNASDEEIAAWLSNVKFSKVYLMMLLKGYDIDRLAEMYKIDMGILNRRFPTNPSKMESIESWKERIKGYLRKIDGNQ